MKRIKMKILIFGLAMSILPFLFYGSITIFYSEKKMEESVANTQEIILHNAVDKLEFTIQTLLNDLKKLRDIGLPYHNKEDRFFLFSSFLKHAPIVDSIYWIDEKGNTIYYLSRTTLSKEEELKTIPTKGLNILSSGKDYIGPVQVSESGLEMELGIPIHRIDSEKGALVIRANLKNLFSNILSKPIDQGAYLYIIDNRYRLIGHKDFSKVILFDENEDRSYYQKLLTQLVNTSLRGPQLYAAMDGLNVVGTAKMVPLTNWYVVLEQPEKEAFFVIEELIRNLTLYTMVVALLVSGISILFALFFSEPIEKMEKSVNRFTKENVIEEMRIQSNDEIGSLSRSITNMMQELNEKSQTLIEEKQRLDMVVSGLGMGLVLMDHNYRITWVNQTVETWFGDRDKLLNLPCSQVVGCECIRCPALTRELYEENKKEITSSRMDRDGRKRYYRHQVFMLYPNKKESSFLEVIEDVTEKREMELMVHQADKLAAIGLLASGLAHEINNPLGILSLYSEDLSDRLKEEDILTLYQSGQIDYYLTQVQSQIDRCKKITRNLLNFSRKHVQDAEQPELVPIHDTIHAVVLLLQHKVEKIGITLNIDYHTSSPVIWAKTGEMQQIFLNILTNAIDAVEDQQGVIDIITYESKGKIIIEVRDNGIGIKDEHKHRIFEPFFTTKAPGKGTGLGLSVCYGIIKNHGGDISIESTWQKGTVVRIQFPIAQEGMKYGA